MRLRLYSRKIRFFPARSWRISGWGKEDASMEEIERACRIACADEFIDRLADGYDTEMGQGGVNVSGGQKQRLCIARAILKEPKVLILDDSTSAVDTATEARIRTMLKEELPEMTKNHHCPENLFGAECGPDPDSGRRPGIGYRYP